MDDKKRWVIDDTVVQWVICGIAGLFAIAIAAALLEGF
jgi:hypothetical protein